MYFKSAQEKDLDALGICYEKGIGIEKDEKKAFGWYLKSANEGNSNAQTNLGRLLSMTISPGVS